MQVKGGTWVSGCKKSLYTVVGSNTAQYLVFRLLTFDNF